VLGWNQAANEHAWNLGCPCDAMTPCPACQAAPSPAPAALQGCVLQRLPAALLREWHALAKFEHWASCTEHYHGITRAVPVRYLCNTQVSPVHDLCITMALPVHYQGVTCASPWHHQGSYLCITMALRSKKPCKRLPASLHPRSICMPSLIWGIPILVQAILPILPCALQLPMESHTLPFLLLDKYFFDRISVILCTVTL